MNKRISAILLLVIGFATPYLLGVVFSSFLYASAISAICFWSGMLLIFSPLGQGHPYNPYFKWASYAIFLNMALTTSVVLYFHIMKYFGINNSLGLELFLFLDQLANPVETIFNKLVPLPIVRQADGSFLITESAARSLLTNFSNLVFLSISGIFAKKVKNNYCVFCNTAPQRQFNETL